MNLSIALGIINILKRDLALIGHALMFGFNLALLWLIYLILSDTSSSNSTSSLTSTSVTVIAVFNIVYMSFSSYKEYKTKQAKKKRTQRIHDQQREHTVKKFTESPAQFNLNIRNFQGIYHLQQNLPFNAPWIFLTGNNGYGKTNILQAIARVLSPAEEELSYNAINPVLEETDISLDYMGLNRTLPTKTKSGDELQYRLMGYGTSRINMGSDSSFKKHKPCSSLFEPQVLMRNIEREGLSRWYFKENDKEKFEQCVEIFKELMPNLAEIIVEDDSEVWYIEKDNEGNPLQAVQFKDLASGYQNIISMIGDMILNLNSTTPSSDNVRDIVLIDELELYLHPSWQKRLPQILTDLFPNILFIASTHSPIPLLGAPKGSAFFTVNRTVEDGITMTRLDDKLAIDEMMPNTLLTSPLFGMEDIFANGFTGEKNARTEQSYGEMQLNDAIDKKVDDFMTDKKEQELIERFKNRKSS
jgi:AAA15 family ATPase/GTPase